MDQKLTSSETDENQVLLPNMADKSDIIEIIDPGSENLSESMVRGEIEEIESMDEDDVQMNNSSDDDSEDDSEVKIGAHTKDAFCVDVFEDKWLATGGEDDCAMLFDITNIGNSDFDSEPILRIDHVDSVNCIHFNSSGLLLATGDMSGKIIITDLTQFTCIHQIDDCAELEWFDWHSESDVLFVGCATGIVWVFCISTITASTIKVYPDSSGISSKVGKVLNDGHRLLSGFADGTIRIWSLLEDRSCAIRTEVPCTSFDAHRYLPLAAIGGTNGKCVVINTLKDKVLRLVDVSEPGSDGNSMESSDSCANSIESLRFSDSHDSWLALGTNAGVLLIYDVNKDTIRHRCVHEEGRSIIACRWFDPTENIRGVISASFGGNIRVWDARSGSVVLVLRGNNEGIFDLAISPQSSHVYTVSAGGYVRMFDLPSEQC